MKNLLLIGLILLSCVNSVLLYEKFHSHPNKILELTPIEIEPLLDQKDVITPPKILEPIPGFLQYPSMIAQLKKWSEEAKDFVEVGSYGTSTNGSDLVYMRLSNKKDRSKIDGKVLLTACIHGNEPISAATILAYCGNLLKNYTPGSLLDRRDIFVIPVINPDSYPYKRELEGVDPNRNFEKNSISSIVQLKNFFLKEKFNAVLSGHSYGRVFLYPWGDKREYTNDQDDFKRILAEMCRLSGYGSKKASLNYGHPIYGTELDWYYKNGAFSLVMEFGTHQRIPSMEEIRKEWQMTFKSIDYFIEESPKVDINSVKYCYAMNRDEDL